MKGADFKRHPRQIGIAKVVTLRAGLAALALFGTGELLEFAVKLLNRPAPGIHVLNSLRGDWVWSIGDDPVNVAVCGDYLEQSDQKRQFLEFDGHPVGDAVGCPVNVLNMNIALLLAERDQAVVLDGRDEDAPARATFLYLLTVIGRGR